MNAKMLLAPQEYGGLEKDEVLTCLRLPGGEG
jgi:hypothetical protein